MHLSRRDMIALMLGLPAMATGCTKLPVLPKQGELLGQSIPVGHRLRDGFRPRPSEDRWNDVQVAIVGGGVAGLAAARKLQQGGCEDFVVLELESTIGGTSRYDHTDICAYPWGAHYVPVPLPQNREMIGLLSEMGVVELISEDGSPVIAEQCLCREPEERLFYQGEWIEDLFPAEESSSEDLEQLAAFRREIDRWADWRDSTGRRAFAIPISQATDDPAVLELDKISMGDWMRDRGLTSARLKWFVDYGCRDDYGLLAEDTSAWAGLLYFAARMKSAGASPQPFITWSEGNGHIVEHLANRAGPRVRSGMAVTQITPVNTNGRDRVEVVCLNTQTQEVTGLRARHVISALPQFMATRLIDGFAERTGRKTNQFEYGSWLVANLHLSDRPREETFPLSWDNVIHSSQSLGYVVATHQSGRDHGPTVWTWYYPYCGTNVRALREQLQQATWAELADIVLADLEVPHPDIRSLTTRLDLFRWGHAMIRPKPGFITGQQRLHAQVPDGRIHFANTDLSGIALFEEAFDHGCRAATEVLQSIEAGKA